MNARMREIIKMALLYLQANRDDFIAAHEEDDKPFQVNGVQCDPPTEQEVEDVLLEFQDVL